MCSSDLAKIASGEGLGFAIPINQVKPIVNQIVETGAYKIVYMGIKGLGLKEYESLLGVDLSPETGVMVLEVEADSPAAKAGLESGDVITKIGDKEVNNMDELKSELYNYNQGDTGEITIIRNTEEETLEIEYTIVK